MRQVHDAEIVVSAVRASQYPKDNYPEIAFAGRSNVGKSSMINTLLNRKNLARTSSKPGKTATINFYRIENSFYLVDLPGYGYAKVSKEEKKKWAGMMDEYLSGRENLYMVVLLVDSRHAPTPDDIMMLQWIKDCQGNAVVLATKWDKLKKSEQDESLKRIKNTLQLEPEDILIPFSGETRVGREELWELIDGMVLNGEI